MNKNILIGALAVILIIGGGYMLLKDKSEDALPTDTVSNDTSDSSSNTGDDTSTTPPVTISVPVVVTNPNVTVSNSTALVTGQVTPRGASTMYWFEYGETNALGSKTASQQIGSGYTALFAPAQIIGLRADTLYYFRLSAKNGLGTVNGTLYTFRTNNNPPSQGVAPTTRTQNATAISRTTANLNGTIDPNGSETSFWFEYGKNNDLGNITALQSVGSGNSSTSVSMSLSNLEPLTKYFFRLNAQNQYGTINGAILNFTTSGPAAVSAPSVVTTAASNITTSGARLHGRINPNGLSTDYWFEYSEDSLLGTLIGSGTPVQNLNAGTSTVNVERNITGLKKSTTYFYRLVGRNGEGTVRGTTTQFTTRD